MKLSEVTKKRIRISYSVALSVMIAVCGVLFAVSCYLINAGGEHPFTVESVSQAFDRIKIPVFLMLAALIGSIALHIIIPEQEEKLKPYKMNGAVLKRMTAASDSSSFTEEVRRGIEKERRLRLLLGRALAALIILSAVLPLIYVLNPNNFPAEEGKYNSEILSGMLFYAFSLCPLFIYSIVHGALIDRSLKREIELLREAKRSAAPKTESTQPKRVDDTERPRGLRATIAFLKENKAPIMLGARISLFAAAVVFITVGAVTGGSESVLAKAVKICTECIGLG